MKSLYALIAILLLGIGGETLHHVSAHAHEEEAHSCPVCALLAMGGANTAHEAPSIVAEVTPHTALSPHRVSYARVMKLLPQLPRPPPFSLV